MYVNVQRTNRKMNRDQSKERVRRLNDKIVYGERGWERQLDSRGVRTCKSCQGEKTIVFVPIPLVRTCRKKKKSELTLKKRICCSKNFFNQDGQRR